MIGKEDVCDWDVMRISRWEGGRGAFAGDGGGGKEGSLLKLLSSVTS